MAEPNKRLGRGLSSLMSPGGASRLAGQLDGQAAETDPAASTLRNRHVSRTIPLRAIRPNPDQPRRAIREDSVRLLAESIKRSGIIQPVVVRLFKTQGVDGQGFGEEYELVAGERRWRAAHLAGLSDVPAIVRDAADDELLELALVENIHREDLNAIDRAKAYQQFTVRFGLSPEEVGARTGEDRSTVSNYLRLLELPKEVRDMVSNNLLSMGHARALLGAEGEEDRLRFAKAVVIKSLSVRALEELIRQRREDAPAASRSPSRSSKRPLIRDFERQFSEALQAKVQIREGRRRGRGKIVIEYASLDDFDRICEIVGLEPESR